MAAADVERSVVDGPGPAKTAGVFFLLENEEIVDAAPEQRTSERETGRAGADDRNLRFHFDSFIQSSFHRHLRICLPVAQALKCVTPPSRGDSDVGNSIRLIRAL